MVILNPQKQAKASKISLLIILSVGINSFALAHSSGSGHTAGSAHTTAKGEAHSTAANSVGVQSQSGSSHSLAKPKSTNGAPALASTSEARASYHPSVKKMATLSEATAPASPAKNKVTSNTATSTGLSIQGTRPNSPIIVNHVASTPSVTPQLVHPTVPAIQPNQGQNKKKVTSFIKLLSEYGMTLGGSSAIISAILMLLNYRLRKRIFSKIAKRIKFLQA